MPSTNYYKKGRKGGVKQGAPVQTRQNYSKGEGLRKMEEAIELFRSGEEPTLDGAAEVAGVDRKALRNRLYKPNMKSQCGRQPALDPVITENFAEMAEILAEMGYPLNRRDLQDLVAEYCRVHCPNVFNNDGPSREWVLKFLYDHPRLTLRTPEQISVARVVAFNEVACQSVYGLLQQIFEKHPTLDARSIYNADETAFSTDPESGLNKVISRRGVRNVSVNIHGTGRTNFTVLACGSAAGQRIPPLILYSGVKYQAAWYKYLNSVCRNSKYAKQCIDLMS